MCNNGGSGFFRYGDGRVGRWQCQFGSAVGRYRFFDAGSGEDHGALQFAGGIREGSCQECGHRRCECGQCAGRRVCGYGEHRQQGQRRTFEEDRRYGRCQ